MTPGRESTTPEQDTVRVARFDEVGSFAGATGDDGTASGDGAGSSDDGAAAPVARLDATGPAGLVRPAADLTGLDALASEAAPVASFAPGDDGGAGGATEPDAAPVALFDAGQLASARDVPVAELGTDTRGRSTGRRAPSPGGGERRPRREERSVPDRSAPDRSGPGRRADSRGGAARDDAARDGGADTIPDADPPAPETGGRRGRGRAERRSGAGPERDGDPVVMAREICLRLLTDRARTRQELAQALRRKGIPDDAAATVLERFDEVGLIDDAAFAGQWVRSRHAYRGLARRAIAVELRRKGVDDEVAGEALAEVDGESEERRARQLVDRKLRSLTVTTPEQQVVAGRRLVGMLARKGYGAGVAYRVVREALAQHGAELDDAEPPDD
ncbi:regulatory protein RecX [Pseudonocardia xinjiangensis]